MDELGTIGDIAPKFGVSRQAVDQALARSADRPLPVLTTGGMHIYNIAEVVTWWEKRAEGMWRERRRKGLAKAVQINVRIGPQSLATLDLLRTAGETRSAAAHRVLVDALERAAANMQRDP